MGVGHRVENNSVYNQFFVYDSGGSFSFGVTWEISVLRVRNRPANGVHKTGRMVLKEVYLKKQIVS